MYILLGIFNAWSLFYSDGLRKKHIRYYKNEGEILITASKISVKTGWRISGNTKSKTEADMLTNILTNELIWYSYNKYFLIPFDLFTPWIITFLITLYILNKILNHLYYRLIQSGNSKYLVHKKVKVLCTYRNTKSSNKDHDTFH